MPPRRQGVGYTPSQGPISMPPVVPPEPDAGNDLAPYRYGGPRLKNQKHIKDANSLSENLERQAWLHVTPPEMLYHVFDYLCANDLKNVAVTSKRLCRTAVRYLNTRFTWTVWDSRGVETEDFVERRETLAKSSNTKYIASADLFHCSNRHDAFQLLRNLSGLKKLSIRFRSPASSPNSYTEADFVAEFGGTLIPQLEELNVYPTEEVCDLQAILQKAVKLERLFVALEARYCHGNLRQSLADAIQKSVGKQLHVLRFGLQDDHGNDTVSLLDLDDHIHCYPSLPDFSSRESWPHLQEVELGHVWIREDKKTRMDRIDLLLSLYKAHKEHSGWTPKFRETLEVDVIELKRLKQFDINFVIEFLRWLDRFKGAEDDDLIFSEDTQMFSWVEGVEAVEELAKYAVELFTAFGRLNLKIEGSGPPSSDEAYLFPVLEKLTPLICRLTLSPWQIRTLDLDGEEIGLQGLTYFNEWCEFISHFIPTCHTMRSLRIRSNTTGSGGDIPLAKFEDKLAVLVKHHRLRELDVDASALTQPENNVSGDIGYTTSPEEPYLAIRHLVWISLPDPRSGWNDLSKNLLNLTRLNLHHIFLHRQTEFIWFTNIPAKLKNLIKLRVYGLVWHAGYDKVPAWGEDSDWEDDTSDASSEDVYHFTIPPSFVPPNPRDDEGREQPENEQEREMNRAMASFFLTEFDEAMRNKLGLTKDNCMESSQYRMMIASRDAMRGELERRERDGTVQLQQNPFLHGHPFPTTPPSPPPPEGNSFGAAGMTSGVDVGNIDPADNSDAESTDSHFGFDPRFVESVDEELRAQRLSEWIHKILIAAARKTGGSLRDVKVYDVRVNAKGLKPWFRRDKKGGGWVEASLDFRHDW